MRHVLKGIFFLLFILLGVSYGQPVPSEVENIPFLMTFGKQAATSWGDNDFSQTFFFVIPGDYKKPIYIRVYDPDCGGAYDELNGVFNTETSFSVYGGKGCYTDNDAQSGEPIGNYKSGNLLATKTFGVNPQYDKNWYTFGPFNPTEGEYVAQFKGHVFKVIVEGASGDDGNLYRFYLSTEQNSNKSIEGANAFTFEYCFRMWDDPNQVSHIYPYVDDRTITVREGNFDWDDDGYILIVSVVRQSQPLPVSSEDNWVFSDFQIMPKEKNTSLDIQVIKRKSPVVRNNNVVLQIKNQYNEALKFYAAPIGGVPRPKLGIGAR